LDAGDHAFVEAEARQRRDLTIGKGVYQGNGRGTLDRDQRGFEGLVFEEHIRRPAAGTQVVPHPGKILGAVGRVHDDDELVRGDPVHDDIIDYTAGVPAQQRVLRAAALRGQAADVVDGQVLKVIGGAGAADPHAAHVRHVEQARPLTHRAALRQNAGVLHRHLPAGELDEAAAGLSVGLV
jgi:hypothetical protein